MNPDRKGARGLGGFVGGRFLWRASGHDHNDAEAGGRGAFKEEAPTAFPGSRAHPNESDAFPSEFGLGGHTLAVVLDHEAQVMADAVECDFHY